MRFKAPSRFVSLFSVVLSLIVLCAYSVSPALGQKTDFFPAESFTPTHTTLPNDKLNFDDDSKESCCSPDSLPVTIQPQASGIQQTAFESANPRYVENSTPSYLISCEPFGNMPENVSNGAGFPTVNTRNRNNLPVLSYSTNVSMRQNADYFTDPASSNTSDFHVETGGGSAMVRLQDVNSYSVCMARGNNIAMVANTDHGSILTYNGNDKIYLAGNNTNMLTRTGAGEDIIELNLTHPNQSAEDVNSASPTTWTSFNIYKTALSGGTDQDALVIRNAPPGTKWCHIGSYKIYGEYFYVVEIALPPTVTEGPRRQRLNIGQSIEYVEIKGRKYYLQDFLTHGSPADTIAQSIPLDAPLPNH